LNKPGNKTKSEWSFSLALAACFVAGVLLVVSRHEMWRDEVAPWMIAKYTSSLRELFANARYEGHPIPWYLVLYVITRFTTAPEAMQYVNVMFSASMVVLVARCSPFSRWFKVLFTFGFYPFYQYAVTSRGYALCTLMLFAMCALYPLRKTRLPVVALLMAVMANTDVYGWFYCVGFSVGIIVQWFLDRRNGKPWKASAPEFIACAALVLAGMVYSVKACAPPADGGWYTQWYVTFSWDRLWKVLCSFAFDFNFGWLIIYVVPTLALLGWFTLSIRRKPAAMVTWVSFVVAIAVFYYTKFLPLPWNKGMVLMFIVACLWLSREEKELEPQFPKQESILDRVTPESFVRVFAWVLALYVLYGGKWIAQDLMHPYSTAKMAADFIKRQSLENSLIVGDPDFVTQSVSGYLDKPIYYTASRSMGRYVIWNNKRRWPRSDSMDQIAALRAKTSGRMIYIANRDTLPVDRPGFRATLLSQMPPSVMKDERLWIYEIDPAPGGAAAQPGHGR